MVKDFCNPVLGAIFTSLGFLTGALAFYLAQRATKGGDSSLALNPQQRFWILVAALGGGILGAKLSQWLLLGWPVRIPWASILQPDLGGRTILGGILVGWICVEFAKWRMGVRGSLGGPFAIGLAAGEAVGRIGCLFNACCYGAALAGPHPWWAIYQHGAWRVPVQLLSALAAGLVLLALLALRPRLKRDGDLFYWYLLLMGAARFGLEFLRGSEHVYCGFSLAQLVSAELFAAGGIALCLRWWKELGGGNLNRRSAR